MCKNVIKNRIAGDQSTQLDSGDTVCLGTCLCCFLFLLMWGIFGCMGSLVAEVRMNMCSRNTCQFWEIPNRSYTVTAFRVGRALRILHLFATVAEIRTL